MCDSDLLARMRWEAALEYDNIDPDVMTEAADRIEELEMGILIQKVTVTMTLEAYKALTNLKRTVQVMAEIDDGHGTGFYNNPVWKVAYDEARRLAGRAKCR